MRPASSTITRSASRAVDKRCATVNTARPLIFSTGLPPAVVAAALAALDELEAQPRMVARLQSNAAVLREALAREGFAGAASSTQIVPLVVGDAAAAVAMADGALEQGVFAQAIRPPTVPDGTSRLRLAVMATHTRNELREAASVLARAAAKAGVKPTTDVPDAATAAGAGAVVALDRARPHAA